MIRSAPEGVAIVGGGPGGLAAAVLLAARGLPVTVYERAARVGGRTTRLALDAPDGGRFHVDRGPTFFLMPQVLQEIFSAAGRRLADAVDLRRLDPMYRLVIGGDEPVVLDATQDVAAMAARIARISPPDGPAFERFMCANRAKLRAMEPILRRRVRGPRDLLDLDALRALRHLHPFRSVHAMLERTFEHPAVRLATGFQSKYLGMSPWECPSLFTILPFIEYEWGVWHPIGGCAALTEALADLVRDLGGRIETGAEVDGLVFEGRRLRAVSVDGRERPHRHVVLNADAGWALPRLVPERLRGRFTDRHLAGMRYSCSTMMLYLGLDGAVDLPHHVIHVARDYRANLDAIAAGRLVDEPSLYVCNPSVTDPTLAPPGRSSLYVLVPVPNRRADIDWREAGPRVRRQALDQIARRLGVTDLERRIVVERTCTPDDWAASNIAYGATFSFAHGLDQMLHRRPPHRLPGADGVWLVGGGTHPGSGLPVIFLSAQITADALLETVGAAARRPQGSTTANAAPASRRSSMVRAAR